MRFARWVVWISLIYLTSCVPSAALVEDTSQSIEVRDVVRPVSHFTKVYIEGPFDVRLHTHADQKPSLKMRASVRDLKKIRTTVKDGVLYVMLASKKDYFYVGKKRYKARVAQLDINIPKFHALTYRGEGVVKGRKIKAAPFDLWIQNPKTTSLSGWIDLRHLTVVGPGHTTVSGLHSRSLSVMLEGDPEVELSGRANLRSIDINGSPRFSLHWIKSGDLVIRAKGDGQLQLAGVVNRIDGVFSGRTHFDARYLRVKEAFIKTNDEAVADVSVTENQHALARDKSDIYYYNLPPLKTDFMARNGAVLDMRPDALKMVQPYTIYNH